jgi:hypothetical protein
MVRSVSYTTCYVISCLPVVLRMSPAHSTKLPVVLRMSPAHSTKLPVFLRMSPAHSTKLLFSSTQLTNCFNLISLPEEKEGMCVCACVRACTFILVIPIRTSGTDDRFSWHLMYGMDCGTDSWLQYWQLTAVPTADCGTDSWLRYRQLTAVLTADCGTDSWLRYWQLTAVLTGDCGTDSWLRYRQVTAVLTADSGQ